MTVSSVVPTCTRCGRPLERAFRFCPECGLPSSGGAPLSTEIEALRQQAEEHRGRPSRRGTKRLVFAWTGMGGFVLAVGLALNNPALLDRLLPPEDLPEPMVGAAPDWEPDWVWIPPGDAVIGPAGERREMRVGFYISKYEVDNALWWRFVREEEPRLREEQLLNEAIPGADGGWVVDGAGEPRPPEDALDRPVRNVSALAAMRFCRWITERLGEPEFRVTLPLSLEWEYAARGPEGRRFPWGDEFSRPVMSTFRVPEAAVAPKALGPLDLPVEVTAVTDDVTPGASGIVALGTNVAEWVLASVLEGGALPREVYIRGGSFQDPWEYESAENRTTRRELREKVDAALSDHEKDELRRLIVEWITVEAPPGSAPARPEGPVAALFREFGDRVVFASPQVKERHASLDDRAEEAEILAELLFLTGRREDGEFPSEEDREFKRDLQARYDAGQDVTLEEMQRHQRIGKLESNERRYHRLLRLVRAGEREKTEGTNPFAPPGLDPGAATPEDEEPEPLAAREVEVRLQLVRLNEDEEWEHSRLSRQVAKQARYEALAARAARGGLTNSPTETELDILARMERRIAGNRRTENICCAWYERGPQQASTQNVYTGVRLVKIAVGP